MAKRKPKRGFFEGTKVPIPEAANNLPTRPNFSKTTRKKVYTGTGSYTLVELIRYSGTPVLVETPDHPEDNIWVYPETGREVLSSGAGATVPQATHAANRRKASKATNEIMKNRTPAKAKKNGR